MFTSDSLQKPYLSPCLTKKVSTVQYEEQSGESSPHFHITGGPGVLFQIHKVDPCNENEVQQRSHNWPWKMAAAFTQSHPWIVRKPDLAFNFQWNAWAWNIKKFCLQPELGLLEFLMRARQVLNSKVTFSIYYLGISPLYLYQHIWWEHRQSSQSS